jgi:hypothetical protein
MGASKVREWDVSLSHHICKKTPGRVIFLHVGQQPARRGAAQKGQVPSLPFVPNKLRRGGEGEKKVIGETQQSEHLRTNERLTTTTRDRVLRRALSSLPAGKSTTPTPADTMSHLGHQPSFSADERLSPTGAGRVPASSAAAPLLQKRFVVSAVKSFFVSVSPVDTILRI